MSSALERMNHSALECRLGDGRKRARARLAVMHARAHPHKPARLNYGSASCELDNCRQHNSDSFAWRALARAYDTRLIAAINA